MNLLNTIGVPFQVGGKVLIDPSLLNPFWHITAESINFNSVINLYGNFPNPISGDGDAVGAWQDYGNTSNYSPVQTTAGNRPVWRSNILNGMGIIRPDVVDDKMGTFVKVPAASWNSFTLIVTAKQGASSALIGVNDGTENGAFTYRTNSSGKPEILKGFVASLATATNALPSGFCISVVEYDGSTFSFYTNGAANGTTSVSTTFSVDGSGVFHENGLTLFNGDFNELYAFTPKLTVLQRNGITNFQNRKAGYLF